MDTTYGDIPLPQKPKSPGASGGTSQKDRRFTDTFFDTHKHPHRFPRGRPFTGEREYAANPDQGHEPGFISSNLQCGEYVTDEAGINDRTATLRSVWHAPWLPLEKYWSFDYKRKVIRFGYQKMRTDEEQGLNRYFQAAAKLGIQLNIRVEKNTIPHPQIVAQLGEPSRLGLVAEAAMAQDPWLLGFHDEPNPQLAEILGYSDDGLKFLTSYEPPPRDQAKVVNQVLAAPINQDLMAMLAQMTAAAVDQAFAKRDEEKKAQQSAKAKEREEKAAIEREAYLAKVGT